MDIIYLTEKLFQHVLAVTPAAAVLIVMILMVRKWFGARISPRIVYGLWLLLIVRLVMPWSPPSVFSLWNAVPDKVLTGAVESMKASPAEQLAAITNSSPPVPRLPLLLDAPATALVSQGLFAFFLVWLAVAGGLMLLYLVSISYWSYAVHRASRKSAVALEGLLDECKRHVGVRRSVGIYQTSLVHTPMMSGLISPRILIPEGLIGKLDTQDWSSILMHELVHVRRWDVFWNQLMAVLLIVNWFNPLMWVAYKRMREDQELSCDSRVLEHTGRLEYGRTLLKLTEWTQAGYRLSWMSWLPTYYAGKKSMTRRRVEMIKQFTEGKRVWTPLVLLGLVVVIVLTFTEKDTSALPLAEQEAVFVSPAAGKINVRFAQEHPFISIAGESGTPVYASAEGKVEQADYVPVEGNHIRIAHSGGYVTLYSHLEHIQVAAGQRVRAGDQIGTIGSTGHSTGPHLKFTLLKNDSPADPLKWIYPGAASPAEHDFGTVLKYKNKYMGNASNLINLNQKLPLGDVSKTFQLYPEDRIAELNFKETPVNMDDREFQQAMLYSFTANFVLIDNLDGMRWNLEGRSYYADRSSIEQWFDKPLSALQDPPEWQRQVADRLSDDEWVERFVGENIQESRPGKK